jgi:hypothetical protein
MGGFNLSKVWSCIVAVLAPEMLACLAVDQYLRVKWHFKVTKKMKKGQWTMSQLFFVYMGGVNLEFEDCTEALGCDADGLNSHDEVLSLLQRALQLNIPDMKAVSVEELNKRAKATYLVKAVVCLQASWLVAQVVGRAIAKLPITTLEVVTVGYVVCALITYSCWWHKPQDAEVPISVNCISITKAAFYQQIEAVRHEPFLLRWWERALSSVISSMFGAVHCTAWKFFFPTFAEGVTWRVASVLSVVIPTFTFTYLFFNDHTQGWGEASIVVLLLVYTPVRLYLMVEPFIAFRSVPVGIFYTVNWSSWIPHV